MKKFASLFAAALIALSIAPAAQAATISLSLGTLSAGANGTNITSSIKNLDYTASGKLAADTKIVFTLSSATGLTGLMSSAGSLGKNAILGSAATSSMGVLSTAGTLPVLAVAYLNNGSATVTIENLTAKAQAFTAFFLESILKGKSVFDISYAVSAISSVPLPASALLFATALMALAGIAARKKQI